MPAKKASLVSAAESASKAACALRRLFGPKQCPDALRHPLGFMRILGLQGVRSWGELVNP